jgi:hypothetical protein
MKLQIIQIIVLHYLYNMNNIVNKCWCQNILNNFNLIIKKILPNILCSHIFSPNSLMTSQWMKNPCNCKWYVTLDVIIHATLNFLQLVVFCHLSKVTTWFVVVCVHYDRNCCHLFQDFFKCLFSWILNFSNYDNIWFKYSRLNVVCFFKITMSMFNVQWAMDQQMDLDLVSKLWNKVFSN